MFQRKLVFWVGMAACLCAALADGSVPVSANDKLGGQLPKGSVTDSIGKIVAKALASVSAVFHKLSEQWDKLKTKRQNCLKRNQETTGQMVDKKNCLDSMMAQIHRLEKKFLELGVDYNRSLSKLPALISNLKDMLTDVDTYLKLSKTDQLAVKNAVSKAAALNNSPPKFFPSNRQSLLYQIVFLLDNAEPSQGKMKALQKVIDNLGARLGAIPNFKESAEASRKEASLIANDTSVKIVQLIGKIKQVGGMKTTSAPPSSTTLFGDNKAGSSSQGSLKLLHFDDDDLGAIFKVLESTDNDPNTLKNSSILKDFGENPKSLPVIPPFTGNVKAAPSKTS